MVSGAIIVIITVYIAEKNSSIVGMLLYRNAEVRSNTADCEVKREKRMGPNTES